MKFVSLEDGILKAKSVRLSLEDYGWTLTGTTRRTDPLQTDYYQGYEKTGETDIVIKKTSNGATSTYIKTAASDWANRTALTYVAFSALTGL